MQIKATMGYYLTPVRMAVFKKTRNNVLMRIWRKGKPCALLWACKLVQPLWKIVLGGPQKLKIELLYDPAIPLLGNYLKKMKALT